MTYFANSMSTRLSAALLTIVFSAVTVLGAVGPAYTGSSSSHQVTASLANVQSTPANSLA